MWTRTDDGSIINAEGKVIFFSNQRFVNDIALGGCCFICGAKPGERKFNNEHVFPEWLLRRFNLFSHMITLPNGVSYRYDRYTVPCCEDCNTLMGREVETPISEVVLGGANAINEFVSNGNSLKMWVWMGLIFLKTHLKDRALRFHLDARKGRETIAEVYDWTELHHLHTVVRCFYTRCLVEPEALGSFLSMPVRAQARGKPFDYGDLHAAQTMFICLDDVALFAVFNDSGGARSLNWQRFEKISAPLSELQARELMVELAFANLSLDDRPTFHSEIDVLNERHWIRATRPELNVKRLPLAFRGKLLEHALQHALPHIRSDKFTHEEMLEAIKQGTISFLFNDKGEFVTTPMDSTLALIK